MFESPDLENGCGIPGQKLMSFEALTENVFKVWGISFLKFCSKFEFGPDMSSL